MPQRLTVLNVGGGSKSIALPAHYAGWEHLLLDIQPREDVDLVHDGRELLRFPANVYDAVYCSHNLEHYFRHEVPRVLEGFRHVLRSDGFCEIRVPDLGEVIREAVARHLELGSQLYSSPAGPITVHDVIYGFGEEIKRSGNPFYAHKCGFTPDSLVEALQQAGFAQVWLAPPLAQFEVRAVAFVQPATPVRQRLLGIIS